MLNKVDPNKPTTELYLDSIIERSHCDKHKVEKGLPCYQMLRSDGTALGAICNGRARSAGFNGKIKYSSLHRSNPKKFKNKK